LWGHKIALIFAVASPTQLAPVESPRVGTLAFFYALFFLFLYLDITVHTRIFAV